MRVMGSIAALFTLAAVALGLMSLVGFGFELWEIVRLLAPVAVGVALFSYLVMLLGKWSARWLNRDDERD